MIRLLGVLAIVATLGLGGSSAGAQPRSSLRVLFLGNSLTATNDLPSAVARIAGRAGRRLEYRTVAPGGYALEDHCVVRFIFSVLADDEARARWIGLIRSAVTEPEATRVFREILSTRIFRPLAEQLGMDEAPLRASLAGSQIVGVVMARHIVLIEPLASLEEERLVDAIAPTIQRYLTAPL